MAGQKKTPTTTSRQTVSLNEQSTAKAPASTDAKAKGKAVPKAGAAAKEAPAKPDATSSAHKMAKVVGNQDMNARLADAGKRRDSALQFVIARLQKVSQRQNLEIDGVANREKWERQVSLSHKGFTLPMPTRWHECAHLYKLAAQALCSGNLSRGVQLLDRALESERITQDSFPDFLLDTDKMDKSVPTQGPADVLAINAGEGCPKIDMPKAVRLADKIMAVRTDADPVKEQRLNEHKGWWQAEEDGDGKPDDDSKKKKPA